MSLRLLFFVTLLAALAPGGLAAPATRVFKAGAATSNITPPLGMEIVGNFAPRPIAKHVHDELHVRCLVLDDGTTKLVFAVADTLSLGRDIWDEAKQKLTDGSLVIYAGPIKDNTGKEVITADKKFAQTDIALESMNYLVAGVKGKIN